MVSDFDRYIRDERGMDYFLAKYIWPPVNGALEQTNSMPDWGKDLLYVGPESWCHGAGPPDWGLASSCKMEQGKLRSLLPGDTKLSTKWRPDMVSSQKAVERYQWTLPSSQVITYAAQSSRRYGFIVTDEALVVLRFTKQRIGHGLAATRPRRAMEPRTYKPFTSSENDASSLSESAPLDSPKSQSYIDNDFADALDGEFLPPEYAVIPMAAHGNGKLTVKLSMFCLCLMAGGDFGSMGYGYPPLDSWRRMDGQSFIHNTSALVAGRLPKNATLFDVDELEP
ncbi:hypothetical protein NM208_g5418 [Fusarium decemcellulare]|uniref:Uncharacterized protein n=1 Tax=Fusarium decemcellulare TaxID=57161 RepID=A0ACC1SH58_9HYPO|nr:hypothetical protein NM208_g5418 [Fusarium decemcellulare]